MEILDLLAHPQMLEELSTFIVRHLYTNILLNPTKTELITKRGPELMSFIHTNKPTKAPVTYNDIRCI
jgi:hypothetical protein